LHEQTGNTPVLAGSAGEGVGAGKNHGAFGNYQRCFPRRCVSRLLARFLPGCVPIGAERRRSLRNPHRGCAGALGGATGEIAKISPDGKWIAYSTGELHHFEGKTFIVPSAGGSHPCGRRHRRCSLLMATHCLCTGSRVPPGGGGAIPGPMDLFLVPIDGGPARETGWTAALRRANIWSAGPISWDGAVLQFSATAGSATDFSGPSQGVANLWRIRLPQRRVIWRGYLDG